MLSLSRDLPASVQSLHCHFQIFRILPGVVGHPGIFVYSFMSTVNLDILMLSRTVFAYYAVGKYAISDAAQLFFY